MTSLVAEELAAKPALEPQASGELVDTENWASDLLDD